VKTPEDEAFEEIERRQGGGFPAKRAMAADKLQEPAQEPTKELQCQELEAWANSVWEARATLPLPVQEPVAWLVYTQDGQSVYVTDNPTDIQADQRALPLYTNPPKRPWVGLTDAERIELSEDIWGSELDYEHNKEIDFARAVEQLLKDKNT